MSRIDEVMLKGIEEKVFPAASLLVASRGDIVYRKNFGQANETMIFDIASLTKPIVTTSLSLLAVREKGLSLNSQAVRYVPAFEAYDKSKITIRHLLKHTSGLPAWRPYFQDVAKEHPDLVGKRESRRLYVPKLSEEPLEMPVAYQRIYSDLGFILLGILLEDFFQAPLDRLFAEKIATPLDLKDTFFLPVENREKKAAERFAPTENSEWRKQVIRGEVHDDNAYTLGGVAGHAGLFSTVDDLHRFLTAVEQAVDRGHPLFPQELTLDFLGPTVKFKLGWDVPSAQKSQAGKYLSKNTIGHLGYTGCSFWADLDQNFHIILLTNRVHPSSKNEAIKEFRPKIHDVVYEELIAKR